MTEPETSKRRRSLPWIPGVLVLGSLTVLIVLQTSNVWKDLSIETASDTLLLYALSSLNFVAFVIFGFIFLRSITKLVRERRALQLGSQIKTRLLLYFAAISILPIVAMAGFSYLFMNRALERWFTQIPENVVRQSRDVQVQAVADQTAKLRSAARMIAEALDDTTLDDKTLERLATAGNLTRIEVLDKDGRTLALAERPLDETSRGDLRQALDLFLSGGADAPQLTDGKGYDLVTAELSGGRTLLIVPDTRGGQTVSERVDGSLREFDRLKDQQATVRQVGFLTLGVLTFLLIFASSWTAFFIARGLTTPIKALAEGAREIGRGNFGHRVDVFAEDEIALLVSSFNEMSAGLEASSAELLESRRYIETVLALLPTGVITLSESSMVITMNRAAERILKTNPGEKNEVHIEQLFPSENLAVIKRLVARAGRIGRAAEQIEYRGKSKADGSPESIPLVARRMAHEIKNPLTPIQLSAERIAKRIVGRFDPLAVSVVPFTPAGERINDQTAAAIVEGTETILREVSGLKSMVDEFSQFARLPEINLKPGDLNELIEQSLLLYQDRGEKVTIELQPAGNLPVLMFDAEQLKRAIVNLIDNAIEAFDEDQSDCRISVKTRFDAAREIVMVEIADNGKGMAPSEFQRLFQPYFSTKNRGTGLGLAIVHRIIKEHGGRIFAAANHPRGARFQFELPAVSQR
ncbi:MAG: HAMP domain-containing protein [Acidobacteria bacterium]|nr:HAMP domain-containing protein [Acidobacteriota bacterium]